MKIEFGPTINVSLGKKKKKPVKIYKAPGDPSPARLKRQAMITSIVLVLIILFISFFIFLTPLNIRDIGLWVTALCLICAVCLPRAIVVNQAENALSIQATDGDQAAAALLRSNGRLFLIPIGAVLVLLVLYASGHPLFHAQRYAGILDVQEAVFADDLSESLSTDSIALMDTKSAKMLGDREIGSLSSVVSQYNVSDFYTQIDLGGKPKKVAPLDYAGFFKWLGNKANGVPGYVIVDPVSMSAAYTQLNDGMVYVPSAYLFEDAARKIRLSHPTLMFGNLHFEVDEEGTPYYLACVYDKKISLFGGLTIKGAIILDPVSGHSDYYPLADVPRWADDVYDGNLLCDQFNWHGTLQNGFINSLIAKKGCRRVTTYSASDEDEEDEDEIPVSDYGYVAKDGDIWIYTGITSVNNDSSNIGFLLANERTGEAHYFNIAGADEKSAMAAAEGEVQEKRYQASFPSLINIDDHPTYIMVLKDASGLVKLFAAVNVEQYNLVTTASTQKECLEKYRRLMGIEDTGGEPAQAGSPAEDVPLTATAEKDITIAQIRYIDINGNTYIYLISSEEEIFRAKAAIHDEMLLLKEGDQVHLAYDGKEIVTCDVIN